MARRPKVCTDRIRIAFDPSDGARSWIGTACRKIPQREPTMNLDWTWAALAATVLVAVYGAAYGRFVGRFFAFDDFGVLAAADRIHVHTFADLLRFFEPRQGFTLYRPLTDVGYFWVARKLLGVDPIGWSLAQLGLHLVNALLVYAIARRLLHSHPAGLATAVVYASAPGHALAVRWFAFFTITGTALAYFAALWIWLRTGPRWRMPATLAAFAVSLLCSEHAVSFPAVVSAVAVLGQGRRDWRRLAREIAPLWIVGGGYVAAKLLFLFVLFPRWDPMGASYSRAVGYGVSFAPFTTLETLGRYVTAAVAPLYAAGRSPAWYVSVGIVTLTLTSVTVAASWLTKPTRAWLGATACGLILLVAGLIQVLFLPAHVYPAYVGIAALGAALAVVAPLTALPKGSSVALGVAIGFVTLHLCFTARAARAENDFRTVEGLSILAARWLSAVQQAAEPGTQEVVVPLDKVTGALFGVAHRLFLCAPYEVRAVRDVQSVPQRPGLVVVPRPAAPMPNDLRAWRSIVRDCPD